MTGSVLVFGANGQLGQELLRVAAPEGLAVSGLNRADCDITDPDQVVAAIEQSGAALVVNAAAYTAVDRAEDEPEQAFAINRDGPALVAAACHAARLPLIQVSTDYVFDGTKTTAYREDDPIAPLGVYGASKAAGEQVVRETLAEHVILRTAWVFGAGGHNFVKTMLRLGASREEIAVVDDQRGSPSPARAIAGAILSVAGELLASGRQDSWGTYHFAGQPPVTWCGLARRIFESQARLTGRPGPRVRPITTADYPTPARRPANSVLDGAKIRATFGIEPADWAAGLDQMLQELSLKTTEQQAQ